MTEPTDPSIREIGTVELTPPVPCVSEQENVHRRGTLTHDEFHAAFVRLTALKRDCKARKLNQHQAAIVMIGACIAEEIDTWPRIRGVLAKFGFDTVHLRIMLAKNSGSDPDTHWWERQPDATYRLIRTI